MSLYNAQTYIDHIRMIVGKSPDYVMSDSVILSLFDRKFIKYILEYPLYQFLSSNAFNTAVGDTAYTVDDDFRVLQIREMTNVTTGTKMIPMGRKDYDIYIQGGVQTGPPTHYFVSGYGTNGTARTVTVWPTPDAINEIRYVYLKGHEPLHLTPSPNYGPFSAIWDEAMIMGVAGDVFTYIQPEKAPMFYQLEMAAAARAYSVEFVPSRVTARPGRTVKAGIKV